MTLAICHACGARKHGAFNRCRECAHLPSTAEDKAKSMLLTDHYLDRTSLEGVSKTLQSGDSVNYPSEELAGMASRMPTKQEDDALFQKWDEDGARFRRQLKQCAIGVLILAAGAMIAWWTAA